MVIQHLHTLPVLIMTGALLKQQPYLNIRYSSLTSLTLSRKNRLLRTPLLERMKEYEKKKESSIQYQCVWMHRLCTAQFYVVSLVKVDGAKRTWQV